MVIRLSLYCSLILSLLLSGSAMADNSLESLKLARLFMFRSAVDLISHRGEHLDQELELQTRKNLEQLKSALSSGQSDALTTALNHYADLVDEGLNYDQQAEDYGWDFNLKFTNSLRDLDKRISQQESKFQAQGEAQELLMEQAIRLEYMSVRYVARAYIGELHTEATNHYFDQGIDALAKDVGHTLKSFDTPSPSIKKSLHYWKFIQSRYQDYSLDLAPYIVARNSRKISQMMFDQAQKLSN